MKFRTFLSIILLFFFVFFHNPTLGVSIKAYKKHLSVPDCCINDLLCVNKNWSLYCLFICKQYNSGRCFFIFKARLEKYIRNEFHHLILAKFRSSVENERSLFLEILASNSFS